MRSLRYLNAVLTIIAVLLTLQLWTTWTVGTSTGALPAQFDHASTAEAAVPNAGAQRKQMIDQLNKTNASLKELTDLFKSGKARVRVDAPAGEK